MFADRNQVVLPLNVGVKIPKDDHVFKLVEICDKLDYTKLYKEYVKKWRKIDPATLFIIMVYAYMRGIYSSREIELACKTDIRFMWILGNDEAPDHSTIARFQNGKLVPVIEDLFYQLVGQLIEMGEVSYSNVFIDGTKIEANANKYTFVWSKAVEKNLKKLDEKMERESSRIAVSYCLSEDLSYDECLAALMQLASLQGIEFVHGKGKRKTQLQRDIDTLMAMGDKRHGYLKSIEYNVQIAVESEYIVGVGLFPNPTDTTTLIPFLERMRTHTGIKIENLVADAGYASEENFDYLDTNNQNAFIKPQLYEVSKTRKYKQDKFRPEHMEYNKVNNEYICSNGKRLIYKYTTRHTSDNNYESCRDVYECESCEGCPYRSQCHSSQNNRRIRVSHKLNEQNRKATELITTDEGIILRMNRSIQVEGAFGVIKQDFGFRRFLTRGKPKVETQFFLIAFAFNIEKLCYRIQSDRFG